MFGNMLKSRKIKAAEAMSDLVTSYVSGFKLPGLDSVILSEIFILGDWIVRTALAMVGTKADNEKKLLEISQLFQDKYVQDATISLVGKGILDIYGIDHLYYAVTSEQSVQRKQSYIDAFSSEFNVLKVSELSLSYIIGLGNSHPENFDELAQLHGTAIYKSLEISMARMQKYF